MTPWSKDELRKIAEAGELHKTRSGKVLRRTIQALAERRKA